MTKRCKYIVTAILMIIIASISLITVSADIVDNTIKIYFYIEDEKIDNADIQIYKVATLVNDELEKEDSFNYPIDINVTDSDDMTKLASTLYGYVKADNIKETMSNKTDENGVASFYELDAGVYLITGDSVIIGRTKYIPNPIVVRLPYTNEDGLFENEARLELKYNTVPVRNNGGNSGGSNGNSGTELTTSVKALKVWHSDKEHPESIRCDLLKNGELWDSQILSEDNNWRYLWNGLSLGDEWLVVERDIPSGYNVTTEKIGITFVITNEEIKNTETDDNTSSEIEDTEDTEDSNTTNDDSNNTNKLPQTGQLWWPVVIFAVLGILLITVGIIKEKRQS